MSKRRPCLWIEGLIGCGKSTFAREIGKRLGYAVLEEPVDSNPYLAKFYEDPKRWAWPMQVELLAQRFALQKHAATISIGAGSWNGSILDRSISGDRVFCKLHMREGNISELEWETYEKFYMIMCETLLPPTNIIYLDCTPETALERIKTRARSAEVSITLDYLQKLESGYNELWEEAKRGLMPWSHAIDISTFHWDPIRDMPNWDRHASRIRDMCERSFR